MLSPQALITYSRPLMERFPDFTAAVVYVNGAGVRSDAGAARAAFLRSIGTGSEPAESAPIKAWRNAYSVLGVNPTKTRNAAEALLRRYAKSRELPRINAVVDTCNAGSIKHHIPIAALDADKVPLPITVRPAEGGQAFTDSSGNTATLNPSEVSFFDAQGVPHARYWNHKQSAQSAVRESSSRILMTVEALHADAEATVRSALADLLRLLEADVMCAGAHRMAWLYRARTGDFSTP